MSLLSKNSFLTRTGVRDFKLVENKIDWETLTKYFSSFSGNKPFPKEYKFLLGLMAMEQFFASADIADVSIEDAQSKLSDIVSQRPESPIAIAIESWPEHAALILAETRYPAITHDDDKHKRVDFRLAHYLEHQYGIDPFEGSRMRTEPYGTKRLTAAVFINTDLISLETHTAEVIKYVNDHRTPSKRFDFSTQRHLPMPQLID